jgi:hypothetical protein
MARDMPAPPVEQAANVLPVNIGAALSPTGRPDMTGSVTTPSSTESDRPNFGQTLQDTLQNQPPDQAGARVKQPDPVGEKRPAAAPAKPASTLSPAVKDDTDQQEKRTKPKPEDEA